jgi:dTDP-4-dehydrorhamnose 3,5-epimerase
VFDTPSFEDHRGSFSVLFEADAAEQAGLPPVFVQDNRSRSRSVGTVRGLHLQLPPWEQGKLIRVAAGRVVDVFVDLRPGSATHGHYDMVELAAEDERQLWIPPGFAHGFCTLDPDTEVLYKVDAPYQPQAERTLTWDDPAVAIDWPFDPEEVILSDKDQRGLPLAVIAAEIADAAAAATTAAGTTTTTTNTTATGAAERVEA